MPSELLASGRHRVAEEIEKVAQAGGLAAVLLAGTCAADLQLVAKGEEEMKAKAAELRDEVRNNQRFRVLSFLHSPSNAKHISPHSL